MKIQPIPSREHPVLDGKDFAVSWWMFFKSLALAFGQGYNGTIVTAKLTSGGTNGSMTFQYGLLISQVAAT
jgi:hypothetical protein